MWNFIRLASSSLSPTLSFCLSLSLSFTLHVSSLALSLAYVASAIQTPKHAPNEASPVAWYTPLLEWVSGIHSHCCIHWPTAQLIAEKIIRHVMLGLLLLSIVYIRDSEGWIPPVWYSSFRIPNVDNGHDHVTFVYKILILWLAMYLLVPNHNIHDIELLHHCVSKWLNETQQNTNKCRL